MYLRLCRCARARCSRLTSPATMEKSDVRNAIGARLSLLPKNTSHSGAGNACATSGT